jgi:hypothetical protein
LQHVAVLGERFFLSQRAERLGKRDTALGQRRQVSEDENQIAIVEFMRLSGAAAEERGPPSAASL